MTTLGKIDVFFNSASRLDYLIPTVNSFLNNMKYSSGFRLILHDDVVKKEESKKIRKWVEESKIFDLFITTEPAKRLGCAIYKELQMAESPYIINWEDDWVTVREIWLDEILEYMEKNRKVNQIVFNHSVNISDKQGIFRPEIDCGTFKAMAIQEWAIGPGVWRTEFAKSVWTDYADAHHTLWKFGFVDVKNGRDMSWMQENVGSYFLGGHGAPGYVKHIGDNSVWNAPIEGR